METDIRENVRECVRSFEKVRGSSATPSDVCVCEGEGAADTSRRRHFLYFLVRSGFEAFAVVVMLHILTEANHDSLFRGDIMRKAASGPVQAAWSRGRCL